MEEIVWFKDVDRHDGAQVGGKGANLGELAKIGAPVPDGFIITAGAYFETIKESGTLDRIRGILYNLNVEDPLSLETKANQCQEEIKKIELPKSLEQKIYKFYKKLSGSKNAYVAVRSSATAEDLPEASFAGQQSTFLNVRGNQELKQAVLEAWASLFEARAIFYRVQKNFDHFQVGIALPVQRMVESEVSGIMFTVDPVTNNKNTVVIEAIYGLGELIVSGQKTPDHYEVDKKTFKITNKSIVSQDEQMVVAAKKNKIIPISQAHRKDQKLPDEKIVELAKIGLSIEKHYYFPQDMEWAYEAGKLYLVQTRPVTTFKEKKEEPKEEVKEVNTKDVLLQGAPASPVIGTGRVVIIKSPKELQRVQKGDVLVTEMTNPDYVPAMKRAIAIVTDKGGRTSHAAIVSRELGIACVVGTRNATQKLKEGMVVTVDGARGIVSKGKSPQGKNIEPIAGKKQKELKVKTATHLLVNLAEPGLAAEIAAKNVDGVGLLRAEFMLAGIGTHPKKFIEDKRQDEFVEKLSTHLNSFGRAFGSRPVIYRASDFKSNEYKNLKGGEKFEPKESNPMLGYRGAFRYIKDPDTFKLELEAIKKSREKHRNLHLMIPFVRSPGELKDVRALVEESGLFEDRDFKFLMMVEIPTNVIQLEEFIKVGIDGVSIGSNDLTMLLLGTDRDNEEVATEFWEMDPSVLWALERVIKTCNKHKITSSICGQAPSVYPELTELLVKWGITSISINPDKINATRELIYEAEKNLLKK
ncbi:MAG: phosphoenolpyruvate synthase [Candidatus Curtissbacteria bacterium]|nr:phosphoenolpyruvate synthase [Candidatus Curtissbacteria bacterium]